MIKYTHRWCHYGSRIGVRSGLVSAPGGGGASGLSSLFANGEAGTLLDFTDATSFRMERDGASAATQTPIDDVVGTWLDQSGNGAHAIALNDATRAVLRQDATSLYIDYNGVNTELICTVPDLGRDATMWIVHGNVISIQPIRKSAGTFSLPKCDTRAFGLIDRALTSGDIAILENHYGMTADVWDFIVTDNAELSFSSLVARTDGPQFEAAPGGTGSVWFDSDASLPFAFPSNTLIAFRTSGTFTYLSELPGVIDIGQLPEGIAEFHSVTEGYVEGNVNDIPDSMHTLVLRGGHDVEAASPDFSGYASFNRFTLENEGGSTASEIDAFLNGLASIASWTGSQLIEMNYTDDELRSSASDAAVATLEGLGVTVNVKDAASDPSALFANGEGGTLLDFTDSADFRMERAGASSATQAPVDDVVGTWLDQSGNNAHAIAPSDAARPVLRQDGTSRYIEHNGVNTELICTVPDLGRNATMWIYNDLGLSIQTIRKSAGTFVVPRCNMRGFGLIDRALTADDIALLESYYGVTHETWDFMYVVPWSGGFAIYDARFSGGQLYIDLGDGNTVERGRVDHTMPTINNLVRTRSSTSFTSFTRVDGAYDVGQLPNTITYWRIDSRGQITGSILDFPDIIYNIINRSPQSKIVGEYGDIPASVFSIQLTGGLDVIRASSPVFSQSSNFDDINIFTAGGMSTAEVDAILIALSNVTRWTGGESITLNRSADQPRSAASDEAVATLLSYGWVLNVKEPVS